MMDKILSLIKKIIILLIIFLKKQIFNFPCLEFKRKNRKSNKISLKHKKKINKLEQYFLQNTFIFWIFLNLI